MKILQIIVITLFYTASSKAQMGINASGSAPAISAMLDVSSTNKGFLPPRMTSAQRTAIASPAEGLIVFDTNTKSNWYFNGSSWVNDVPGAALTLPFSAIQNFNGRLFEITNSNASPSSATLNSNNTGAGVAILGLNSGTGYAGQFSNNSSSTVASLISQTYGSGPAFEGRAGFLGSAGRFEVGVASNSNTALLALTYGDGNAITGRSYGVGNAIEAINNSITNPTLVAQNQSTNGLALELQGGIKVSGTANQKTAFKIVSNAANININQLRIPNTTVANNINDILIITHNYGTGATNNFTKACGVYWDAGFSEWRIYVEDSSAMPVGITFNVLVIKQ
jgi:trimeric autotransporter adhesin